MLLSGKVHKANVPALNCPLFWDYVVSLACALACFMVTVKPLWMHAFRVKWCRVSEQQRMASGSFVLISIFIHCCPGIIRHMPSTYCIAHYFDSHIVEKTVWSLIILYSFVLGNTYKHKTKLVTYSIIKAFHFPNEITDTNLPSGSSHLWVDSNLLYFFPFERRGTSLWSTLASPLCPGDQCRLICLSLEVIKLPVCVSLWLFVCFKWPFSLLKITRAQCFTQIHNIIMHRVEEAGKTLWYFPLKSWFIRFFKFI